MKRIFVSSTFRDMQAERDVLHLEVLPELNEFAAQYGQSIAISDLRWGIDTGELSEEESNRKVLSVCFEQIDECKPYMIVLLGDRYGYIPYAVAGEDTATVPGIADAAGMSVTEMEIRYGALRMDNLSRCVFYFREPLQTAGGAFAAEDAEHAARLSALKRKIEVTAGNRVRYYQAAWDAEKQAVAGLETFSRMITEDVKAMMREEWEQEAKLTADEREQNAAWQYIRDKAAGFLARGAEEAALCGDIRRNAAALYLITGEAGSGKSCFLSKIALDMRREGWQVLPFIAGNGGSSAGVADLLRQINAFLARETGGGAMEGEATFKTLHAEFVRLAGLYAPLERRLLVVVDALDQMTPSDELFGFAWLMDALPENIRFVLSCLDDFPLPKGMPYSLKDQRIPLQPLDDQAEKMALIDGMMEASGKALSSDVAQALINLPGADNPLYLSMFVQRLMMLNADDFKRIQTIGNDGGAINAYMMKLVGEAPDSTAGICTLVLREAAQRINKTQIGLTLGLIAVSRRGLREEDLIALFNGMGLRFSTVDHARMRKYMRSYFLLRGDGRLDFSHRTIRMGFLEAQEDPAALERMLLNHWIGLPVSDGLRQSELPLHAMRLNDQDAMLSVIEKNEYTSVMLRELHDLSLTDGGSWLLALIRHAQSDGRIIRLLPALMKLQDLYDVTAAELAVVTPLLEETIAAAQATQAQTAERPDWKGMLGILWLDLGRAYYNQGMPTKARECYQKKEARQVGKFEGGNRRFKP